MSTTIRCTTTVGWIKFVTIAAPLSPPVTPHSITEYLPPTIALVMLILYPVGVPCLLFVMMWALRDRMNPRGMKEEAVINQREDDHLSDVEPITAFARIYRPHYWWYVKRSM